jgi:hypothetical protein
MALGPGKYDDETSEMLERTHAEAVVLTVLRGDRGTGFAVALKAAGLADAIESTEAIADALEYVVATMRSDAHRLRLQLLAQPKD